MANADESVVLIGCGPSANSADPETLGVKGYNLWRMDRAAMRVPAAFVLPTRFCREYFDHGRKTPTGFRELIASHLRDLESASGLGFGSSRKPLLVSVRSGAPVSMPGMLDTVLDVGLCDATVPGLLRLTGNPRLVWDSYRRLVLSFAEVVHHAPVSPFDTALAERIRRADVGTVAELDFEHLRALTHVYFDLYEESVGEPFPQQPLEQLEAAIVAVWESCASDRAVQYRRLNGLSDAMGTAVTVQRMVYGNAGGTSGAGVAFTRDPASGEPSLYLDFMFNAQGDDVVSGRRNATDSERFAAVLPAASQDIRRVARALEQEFGDMQEFEFTVQEGNLYVLQTRAGKRTPWAALRIAVDQVDEGLIDPATALRRLASEDLGKIERSRIVPTAGNPVQCRGVAAGCGVAIGEVALDSDRALEVAKAGKSVVLVRDSTCTDDIVGIEAAGGILTATGSRTSHAAVVARQLNKPCIVACSTLTIDRARRRCTLAGREVAEGDTISIDALSGDVFVGAVTIEVERPTAHLARVAQWGERARSPA